VKPVAEISAGSRAGRRGRYGIDGGFAGLAIFGVTGAGLAGTAAWAVRHRRPAVAALAGVGGAVMAGSAASYLYSTGPGKRAIWAQLLDEMGLRYQRATRKPSGGTSWTPPAPCTSTAGVICALNLRSHHPALIDAGFAELETPSSLAFAMN